MFTHAGQDQGAAGCLPPKQNGSGKLLRQDEAQDRQPRGAYLYGQRFATVEPMFGNLRHIKQLNRFTLRGRKQVDAQ